MIPVEKTAFKPNFAAPDHADLGRFFHMHPSEHTRDFLRGALDSRGRGGV